MQYTIAGIILRINTDFDNIPEEFSAYISKDECAADCEVNFLQCSEISPPQGDFIYTDYFSWYTHQEGYAVCLSHPLDPSKLVCKLTTDKDWRQASFFYLTDISSQEPAIFKLFTNIIIRNLVLLHHRIIFHASAINWHNNGIAFTAPAGTGKSTQALLWETHMGASVLNDDNPLLRLTLNGITIHGTPWCGSEKKHQNISVPLTAIYVLEQGNENRLRRLQEAELSSYLLPRFFLPYHDPRLMDLALSYYARIVDSIPIYLLQCRPDQEAVQIVHNSINNKK